MSYLMAWLVVGGAAVVGGVGLMFLTRAIQTRWLKYMLCWVPPVLMLVPAPVPGFSGNFAPAFIVLIFEGLFQRQGQPIPAATILLTALLLSVGLVLLASRRQEARTSLEDGSN